MPDDSTDPWMFGAVFGVVVVIIVLMLIAGVATTVYRSARLARRGVNPLTLQQDLAVQALRSEALAAPRSKADRLDELDVLRDTGRITVDEHAAASARILAE